MTDPITATRLANGVYGSYIPSERFKTARISVTAYLPLREDTLAATSLISQLISSGTAKLPTPLELSRELDRLYGATVAADTDKLGDTLVLRAGIIFVEDKYLPENIFEAGAHLLFDAIFSPAVDEGGFIADNFERERRIQLEDIEGEINDKRTFARNRCIAAMCEGDPFGLPILGTTEQVNALTRDSVYDVWRDAIRTACFRVAVTAEREHPEVYEMFTSRLAEVERGDIYIPPVPVLHTASGAVRELSDHMDVAQGKLVLGYAVGGAGEDSISYPVMVMTDMLGGGAYSLLFNNVREKLSLCYYCAARGMRKKGMILIDSGVEFDNMAKAESAIGEQIELLRSGNFDDSLLEASKLSLCGSLGGIYDSQAVTDRWYSDRMFDETPLSPEQLAERVRSVTRADVVTAAQSLTLDTVYRLLGKEDK